MNFHKLKGEWDVGGVGGKPPMKESLNHSHTLINTKFMTFITNSASSVYSGDSSGRLVAFLHTFFEP